MPLRTGLICRGAAILSIVTVLLGCRSQPSKNANYQSTVKARSLTLRTFGRTPERLVRGSYLVNGVAACCSCHGPLDFSKPGWSPVLGKEETGDGMLQTSIEDVQKWDENFYSEQLGGKGFAAELEEPGKLNNGTVLAHAKGLFIGDYRGLRAVKYSGGSGGYHAYLLRFPKQHFSVACLCNLGGVNRASA